MGITIEQQKKNSDEDYVNWRITRNKAMIEKLYLVLSHPQLECYPRTDNFDEIHGSTSETCVICLDDFVEESQKKIVVLRCGHKIHYDCAKLTINWDESSMECAVCRQKYNRVLGSEEKIYRKFQKESLRTQNKLVDLQYDEEDAKVCSELCVLCMGIYEKEKDIGVVRGDDKIHGAHFRCALVLEYIGLD